MQEEIFGPVLTVYVYDDARLDETLAALRRDQPLRADRRDLRAGPRAIVAAWRQALRHAAGNFYINDKPTGAVVGQQPFGGARASGTNDKAGSLAEPDALDLARATIKETFVPPIEVPYPHMSEE